MATASNKCPACTKTVYAMERAPARCGNSHWHKACFKCQHCKKSLVSDFNEFDAKPYCAQCYKQNYVIKKGAISSSSRAEAPASPISAPPAEASPGPAPAGSAPAQSRSVAAAAPAPEPAPAPARCAAPAPVSIATLGAAESGRLRHVLSAAHKYVAAKTGRTVPRADALSDEALVTALEDATKDIEAC